jgi:hypothetical protein
MAERIPGARFVELRGQDQLPFFGDQDEVLGELEEFFTGERPAGPTDRVLATTCSRTSWVRPSGPRSSVIDAGTICSRATGRRRELDRSGGREVGTTGDGFFATFDGPARAVRCAVAAAEALHGIGLDIRAGLHAGEVEMVGDRVEGGIAVHIGARVAGLAGAREVFVSQTVKDLLAGSGLAFEDRGIHALKGVPGDWRVFAAIH